jgi:hypothetical protein
MFCLWPWNKATEFWMGWWDIPSAKETEVPKVPHQDHVDNFFDSQGIVHKEFVPKGKRVNSEFYKGVMDRLLKRIQWVCPAVFWPLDFFLLHNNAPAHKAVSVCQFFLPKKYYNPLPPPVLSRFISTRLFFVPQVANEVKRTPLCGCCWDPRRCNWWIKEGPKEEFSAAFQKLYDHAKACTYANGANFE